MILMKVFIIFDFPVPFANSKIYENHCKNVQDSHRRQRPTIAASYLLTSKALLLYDRQKISVYLEPKKNLKESSTVIKIKH